MRLTVFGCTLTKAAASSQVSGRSTVDRLPPPDKPDVRVLVSPPPVAPSALCGSVNDNSNVSLIGGTGSFELLPGHSVAENRSDCTTEAFIARRGACCLDDAVFSRTPNWVGRDFMFLRQSL